MSSTSATHRTGTPKSRRNASTALTSPSAANLLPIQCQYHANHFAADRGNRLERLPLGGAIGDHVIDDHDLLVRHRCAHQTAAFAVRLRFLAVEGSADRDAVLARQSHGRRHRDGYALVSRAEQHVRQHRQARDRRPVGTAEKVEAGAVGDIAQIEEIRAATARFEHEVAELQHVALDHGV